MTTKSAILSQINLLSQTTGLNYKLTETEEGYAVHQIDEKGIIVRALFKSFDSKRDLFNKLEAYIDGYQEGDYRAKFQILVNKLDI